MIILGKKQVEYFTISYNIPFWNSVLKYNPKYKVAYTNYRTNNYKHYLTFLWVRNLEAASLGGSGFVSWDCSTDLTGAAGNLLPRWLLTGLAGSCWLLDGALVSHPWTSPYTACMSSEHGSSLSPE